jgi:glyoxylase-like metal-dependent hydrolase (beta-lactamase superfamily II)
MPSNSWPPRSGDCDGRAARRIAHRTAAVLLACSASLGWSASGAAAPVKLIPGAFPEHQSPDGNSVIFEDTHGLIVVDTGRHPQHHAAILAYARARAKPIIAIVNTHWHLDHSGGNRALRQIYPRAALYTSNAVRGALQGFLARSLVQNQTLLADPQVPEAQKADLRLDMQAITDSDDLLPDHPVLGTVSLPFRHGRLELHLARYAATAGDTWVYEPRARILAAGDLVVMPVPFFDTACVAGWRRALDELAAVPFSRLYPGHGPVLTHQQFEVYRRAFDELASCAVGDGPKSACIDGWLVAAAPLISNELERRQARAYLDYYIDSLIRKPDRQAALCGASDARGPADGAAQE